MAVQVVYDQFLRKNNVDKLKIIAELCGFRLINKFGSNRRSGAYARAGSLGETISDIVNPNIAADV